MTQKIKCPECGKTALEQVLIPSHTVRLGKTSFEVKDALIAKCSECGKTSVSMKELERWRELQRQYLVENKMIPSPRDIKEFRDREKLTVAQLAELISVTRQTVHGWENLDCPTLTMSPASLLLQFLIADSKSNHCFGMISKIRSNCIDKTPGNQNEATPVDRRSAFSPRSAHDSCFLRKRSKFAPTFVAKCS
jgi:DNA-binding transcriptional regulator YiaG